MATPWVLGVVNLESGKLSGVKSHDYHIFMERLVCVIFRGYLNDDVWKALAKLRHFYRQFCAKEIKKEMMKKLEKEILVLICKLEKIFPPGWFNPIQHLLVHLPCEARLGGL
jgi:sulfur relay (sulfurtransferase) DsrC/TusE family protein